MKRYLLLSIFIIGILIVSADAASADCCISGQGIDANACRMFVPEDQCPLKSDRQEWQSWRDGFCKDQGDLCTGNGPLQPNCCVRANTEADTVTCQDVESDFYCQDVEGLTTYYYQQYCEDVPSCLPDRREPARDVFFTPSITIPGSQFVAGTPVRVEFETIGDYIVAVYTFFVGIAGIMATIMMMYGGLKYVVSFGSAQRMSDAKDQIVSALMGLLIAIGSYMILVTISPRLVEFQGLDLKKIEPAGILEDEEVPQKHTTLDLWRGQNVSTYDALLTQAASDMGFDKNWMKAIMLVESGGNPDAVSPAGACGLMQLLPTTAQEHKGGISGDITCERLKDPAVNIQIAARYLADLKTKTCPSRAFYRSGKEVECHPEYTDCRTGIIDPWVIAAYNGGLGANCSSITCEGDTWWECEDNAGFAETRAYVQKVRQARDKILNDPAFAWEN